MSLLMSERYVIGIDAGGTKTVGLLADEGGNIITKARADGANLVVHGELAVEKTFYQLIQDLESPGPIAAICLGMAGVDREEDQDLVREVMRRLGKEHAVRIVPDPMIALVAGAPDGIGIVVVAGTGSVAYGVDPSGQTARAGGWGYLLGDEGSAFWLGHAAARQGIRAIDGTGPATTLLDRIANELDIEVPDDLVTWFYDEERFRYRVANLAHVVEEAANKGDEIASSLLDRAAQHLARTGRAVTRQLEFDEPYPFVLAGGVFKACPSLFRRLEAILDLPQAQAVRLEGEPALGAVTLALQLLD
jgi:N-acetylglucosamine kinase-like BadF-type ATPase